MLRRITAVILILVLCLGMIPAPAFATESDPVTEGAVPEETGTGETSSETTSPEESVPQTSIPNETIPAETEPPEVTRAQWISALTKAFDMQVLDDHYPDNYFSDLTEDSPYYYDLLLAVEFGVLDIPAGGAVDPDGAATRGFAASTLNFCLGFQGQEGQSFTFSDWESVSDPAGAQVAIDRGWLEPVDGAFMPELPITTAEMDTMLADAQAILAEDVIDEDHENTIVLSDGVVEVPMGTAVDFVSDSVLEVTDCPVNLSEGTVFVVYNQDLPLSFKAVNVEQDGSITRVEYTREGSENALAVCDYEGVLDLDLSSFIPEDEDTTYSVQSTGSTGNPMARGIKYDEETQTLTVTKSVKLSSGSSINVNATITNLRLEVKNSDTLGDYRYVLRGNATTTLDLTVKDKSDLLKPLKLGVIPVGGIGYITVELELNVSGTVALEWEGDVKGGFAYNVDHGTRLIHSFHKRTFTLHAKVEADLGVKVSAMIDVLLFQGSIYLKYGGKSTVKVSDHSGRVPERCLDSFSYFYALIGVSGKLLGIAGINKPLFTIYDADNSPYRTSYHYEAETAADQGKLVSKCTYSTAPAYYTPPTSENFNPSIGSGNLDSTRLYYYDLDDYDNAVITAYCGSSSVLVLPEMVDEYLVAGIEEYTFYGNPKITSIKLPDSLEFISTSAFEGCTKLMLVWTEGTNLSWIGDNAFRDCTALQQVILPDSVTTMGTDVFSGCSALPEIHIPSGLADIPERAFYNCSSLKSIVLPDSVNWIEEAAFCGCTSLSSINLDNVGSLGKMAFYNCTALKEIDMNASWYSENNWYIFGNCSSLTKVNLYEGITHIPDYLFQGCTGLRNLVLPDTVKTLGRCCYAECTGLKSVVIPEAVTEIPEYAFRGCTSLTDVQLPENLGVLQDNAFGSCTALEELTIPPWVYKAKYPFDGCTGLKTVTIAPGAKSVLTGLLSGCSSLETVFLPDSIQEIEGSAFYGCSSLRNVDLGGSPVTTIGDWAFASCLSLETFVMPDTVTTLGKYAFSESGVQELHLSNTLETIGECAFFRCSSLGKINIPASLKTVLIERDEYGIIGMDTFRGCDNLKEVTIEDGLKSIPFRMFANCDGIEYIEIPASVTDIGAEAFELCHNLKTVIFHGELTEIKDSTFAGTDLWWLDLPQGLKKIGKSAFSHIHDLREVRLPDTLEEIGDEAFSNCPLKNVELPENLKIIGSKAFDFAGNSSWKIPKSLGYVGYQAFGWKAKPMILEEGATFIPGGLYSGTDISSTDLLRIPDTVTSFGSDLFANCTELTEVTIPDTVTKLGSGIFRGCTALRSVEIPDSVSVIGYEAFRNCTALETVKLPESLEVLERETFAGCSALEEVTLPGNLTQIGYAVFGGVLEPTCLKRLYTTRNLQSIGDFYAAGTLEVYGVPGSYAEGWAASKGFAFHTVTEEKVDATGITWDAEDMTLFAGDTWQIDPLPVVTPGTATSEITYVSSDPDIVCLERNTQLCAVSPGTATITASIDGFTASFHVTVVRPMSGVKLDVTEATLDSGETLQLNASCDIEGTTNQDYIWTASGGATVDQNGLVTAHTQGIAKIAARASDGSGNVAICEINVRNTVKEVTDPRLLKVGNVDYQGNRYYPNNLDHMLIYRAEGVRCMTVVFHKNTYLEYNKDFLYVYDGNDQLIHTFTGWPNGSWEIDVPGDTVKLHMVTDAEGYDWGYEVVEVRLGSEFCTHSYTSVQTGEPDCIRTAVMEYTCTLCGHRYQETVPALGHNYMEAQTEATCTTAGYKHRSCLRCGMHHRYKQTQEPLGHSYVDVRTDPGCETGGYITSTCERCGDSYQHNFWEPTGHDVSNGVCWKCDTVFIRIITQPKNTAVAEGETATVTIEAEGDGLTYQWYYKNPDSEEFLLTNAFDGPVYSVPMNAARHGRQIYCVITDANGYTATTETVTLYAGESKLEIMRQPESVAALENETVWLDVEAAGWGLTYAWYYCDPGDESFSLAEGYTGNGYSVIMDESVDGRQVYCVITDAFGKSVTTETVTLSINNDKLRIVKDIADVVVPSGAEATVTVEAAGVGLTYAWYVMDLEDYWDEVDTSITGNSYSVVMSEEVDGRQVYCIITDQNGESVWSSTVTLSMEGSPLRIIREPVSDVVADGETAFVGIKAAGVGLTYQWYYRDPGEDAFILAEEYTGDGCAVTMDESTNGRQFYCVITDLYGNSIRTETVALYIGNRLTLETYLFDMSANYGETVSFTLEATGDDLTYAWYVRNPDSTEFSRSDAFTGPDYSVTMSMEIDGQQVYCVITDRYGMQIQTETVTLTMQRNDLLIAWQTGDVLVRQGEMAEAYVEAFGDGLTYEWYFKNPGSTKFSKTNAFTGPSYSVTMSKDRDGRQVYCVITDRYGNQVQTDTVTLSMEKNELYITCWPSDVLVYPGEKAEVSVEAHGDGLTYEWYFKNLSSTKFSKTSAFTGPSYSVTMSEDRDGRQVYCVITDQYGNQIQTNTVTLSMNRMPPVIVTQPENGAAARGETAVVTVEAEGDELTYEWYFRNPGETDFRKAEGVTGSAYEVTMSSASHRQQVYCVITNAGGIAVTTDTVTMYMTTPPIEIITQPEDAAAPHGQVAVVTVEAVGEELTYTWYYTTIKGGSGFRKIEDSNSPSCSVPMDIGIDAYGYMVRCVITDPYGNRAISDTATLSVTATPLEILRQPEDVSVAAGEPAEVSVEAAGDGLTYQWYFKNAAGSKFSLTTAFTGPTYSVTMTEARTGRQVYCVITDVYGKTVTTETATLTMRTAPLEIVTQPESVSVAEGETAKVTVEAIGEGLTYEWYYRNAGGSKFSKTASFTGPAYSVTMSASRDGRQVYCVITDKHGASVTTDTVTLTMDQEETTELEIITQPESVTVAAGERAEILVEAAGDGLTYAWYYKNATGSKFTRTSTFTGPEYTLTMNATRSGRHVYCVITDACGNSVTTDIVTVNMASDLELLSQPEDVTVASGKTAKVVADAVGEGLAYTWYYRNAGAAAFTKTTTFTGDTYSLKMNDSRNGRQVYCIITDAEGNTVATDIVTLRVS